MEITCALRRFIALLVLCVPPPLLAIDLVPVLSGLSSPVFVTHAGDNSNRLFIVEQPGVIRVLRRGAVTATTFVDLRSKIASGGERGLLGLAFHPGYASNGRFFVYYTRVQDGALVIAEHHVSSDPNVADPTERVLLTIPHPVNANHNGGMLAFGPDHLLYIGVGDGGSGNDPPNNAQNLDVLLGKILRIDVDRADAAAGTPYASPADNPFVNAPGRDEIFAYGLRNPWRFSFDRATGVQWVADVGQGEREEVDMPIVRGGNYGWRVFEGSACTGNDPMLCDASKYEFPVFDYPHANGRCSITGGYVYRGSQRTLPDGTYVYGDYCSGEIFAWDGIRQAVLLDTQHNIASFGEDEQGELYVVALDGSVSRIAHVLQSLDQHGLTGSWYEPSTSGQGMEIELFPDLAGPGNGVVQVGWFTFDTVAGGVERQRWYTLSGTVASGAASASLAIYQNVGGNFQAAPITRATQVGNATLRFTTCDRGTLDYTFSDGSGRNGTVDLTRLTQNVTCVSSGVPTANADFALSGNWYDPATSGQGIIVEINPVSSAAFFAWYTYAQQGAAAGAAGQRWFTGLSGYAAGTRTVTMTVYETTGGRFDATTTPPPSSTVVGIATLAFQSCTAATLTYVFNAGSNANASGAIGLRRVGPVPPGCAM